MHLTEWLRYALWLLIFVPFWLFGRLLKKAQKEHPGYNSNDYGGPPIALI